MRGKIKKLKSLRQKRLLYLGGVFLLVFSSLTYLFVFRPAPGVRAATIGNTSVGTTANPAQRKVVVASTGKMVAFFNTGSQSTTGIAFSVSSDNGSTWSAAAQVDSVQTSDFSVTIDGQDDIYIAYTEGGIRIRKLTHNSGSWTVGSEGSVILDQVCEDGVLSGWTTYSPTIAVRDGGYTVTYVYIDEYAGGGCATENWLYTSTSTNFSSWTTFNSFSSITNLIPVALAAQGKSTWMVFQGKLYIDFSGSGTWTEAKAAYAFLPVNGTLSLSYGHDNLHIFYNSGSSLIHSSYSTTNGAITNTTISTDGNDIAGSVVTDSHNAWVIYGDYIGSNSYNVVYKRYNGSSWDGGATNITTDNLNNVSILAPERMPGTANIPAIWTEGTSSPYSLKSGVFSNIGTVTDTGSQSAVYSGTLTGGSGDTIVKCGVWYYDTVNIVTGMTVKVCSSNGALGGKLEIYANTITIAGSIDGSGRGYPGGVTLVGLGGDGGNGDQSPTAGFTGNNFPGGPGSGAYGNAGGSAGTNSSDPGWPGFWGGGAGEGGGGTASSGSNASGIGGYLAPGGNGDTTINESLVMGSGGGAGGGGGSGAGGGGGMSGTTPDIGFPGCGGIGGNGAAGGMGGKGGNGGALIKLIAVNNVSIAGTVTASGQSGTAGGNGGTGASGTDGQAPSGIGCAA